MNQCQIGGLVQHEDDEGDLMQAGEHAGQALIVASQPTATSHPGKASFHHPAARQQDKATFGLGQG